jgi:hypothetical protein
MGSFREVAVACGALFFVASTSSPAQAELMVGSSLEWLTCSSAVVVVGQIEQIDTTRGPGSVLYDDCTVKVVQTIKGKPKDRLVFCLRRLAADSSPEACKSPAQEWMKSKEGVLLFLSPSKDNGPEKRLDGMLVPTKAQLPLSVVNLSSPEERLFDARCRRVTGRKAILDTARKAADAYAAHLKANPKAEVKAEYVEAPTDSDAWRALYAGSSVSLKVPDFLAPGAK